MSTLIIPVGIPGSGKSTWAREVFSDAEIVSTDLLRTKLFGSLEAAHETDKKDTNNNLVFDLFHGLICVGLSDGYTIVADATNLNAEARTKLRDIAALLDARTHLILFRNVIQATERNAARGPEDRVPEAAMANMIEKYWDTLSMLPQEPYNRVTEIVDFR